MNTQILITRTTFFIIVIFIFITGCVTLEPNDLSTTVHETPSLREEARNSTMFFTTMDEVINWADLVIIGRPIAEKEIINTARDPNDTSLPHPEIFGIGQVYEVEADDYLKGEGPNRLFVIQNHGLIFLSSPEHIVTESEIEQAEYSEDTIPILLNHRYILFLKSANDALGNLPVNYYLGNVEPWRFEINTDNCVQPVDEISDIYKYFPAIKLDVFIQYIDDPSIFPEIPYPAPSSSIRCASPDINSTPYP